MMEFLCFVIFSLICQVSERELRKEGITGVKFDE